MPDTLTQPSSGRTRTMVVVVVLLVVAVLGAAAFYTYYLGMPLPFLQGRLVGPDRGSSFTPLVSHARVSGAPCYDNGTSYCEKLGNGTKRTVGFLFQQRPTNLPYDSVYGCVNMRSSLKQYMLTTTYTECRQQNLWPYFYGYVAKSDDFEASTPLIYCEGTGEVVPVAADCQGTARQLGYMMMSAPGALTGVCKDLAEAGGTNSSCAELAGSLGTQRLVTNSPWRNAGKPADVNGDGATTPQDLLVLVNAYNSNRTGQLSATPGLGEVPPYLDVNGDGAFTVLDFNTLVGSEDWRTSVGTGDTAATTSPIPVAPSAGEGTPVTQPWQNPRNAKDVNNDGFVTPQDHLVLTNELNRNGPRALPAPSGTTTPPPYLDVNGDGNFSSADIIAWNAQ